MSTYFVSFFKALSLDSSLSVSVDCDAWCVLGSENIVNFANKLFVLSPNHTGKQWNTVALDHAYDLSLANM